MKALSLYWRADLLSSSQSRHTYNDLILPTLDEESVMQCLEEFMDSDYGKTMFGRHDAPASVGITGSIEFECLDGPEATLGLYSKFWHRRETVLGRAAMYLNARIPELASVRASSPSDLEDFVDVIDEYTGEVIYREDKRLPDFNGDRETMEYQELARTRSRCQGTFCVQRQREHDSTGMRQASHDWTECHVFVICEELCRREDFELGHGSNG